jgi:hypothetical protein
MIITKFELLFSIYNKLNHVVSMKINCKKINKIYHEFFLSNNKLKYITVQKYNFFFLIVIFILVIQISFIISLIRYFNMKLIRSLTMNKMLKGCIFSVS